MIKQLLVGAALVAVAGTAVVLGVSAADANAKRPEQQKVTICHRTNSVTNPYVQITVSKSAVDGQGNNDHTHHTGPVAISKSFAELLKKFHHKWGDIIPPFDDYAGYNWGVAGQAIYNHGCNYVGDDGGDD